MKGTISAKVDTKGRLALPSDLRKDMHIEAGDVFFIKREKDSTLRLVKAENPFDILAKQAIAESKAGKTISLEEYAKRNHIPVKTRKPQKRSRV